MSHLLTFDSREYNCLAGLAVQVGWVGKSLIAVLQIVFLGFLMSETKNAEEEKKKKYYYYGKKEKKAKEVKK